MIKLGDGQVFAFPPFAAAVIRVPHSAVVSHKHHLRIGWVDPHVVRIAVSSLKTAYYRKTFACVLADNQCSVGLEEAVRILWIHNEIREVERAPYHPLALVALVPGHSAVIGNEQRALWRFDKHINALRV